MCKWQKTAETCREPDSIGFLMPGRKDSVLRGCCPGGLCDFHPMKLHNHPAGLFCPCDALTVTGG